MLQQVMTNPGEIIFREVPVPEVKENHFLAKIMNIGVCGSIFMFIMENIQFTNIRKYKDMRFREITEFEMSQSFMWDRR